MDLKGVLLSLLAAWVFAGGMVSGAVGKQIDLLDFARIEEGMTEAEVLVRLGPPDQESFEGYAFDNAVLKSYFYLSEPERYQNIITVIQFKGGRVIRKERIYRQD